MQRKTPLRTTLALAQRAHPRAQEQRQTLRCAPRRAQELRRTLRVLARCTPPVFRHGRRSAATSLLHATEVKRVRRRNVSGFKRLVLAPNVLIGACAEPRGHGQRVTHRFTTDPTNQPTNQWITNALSIARSDLRVAYRDPAPVILFTAYTLAV